MNLKTNFQKLAVKLITKTFGDVAQKVVIRHPIYDNYDEETGSLISFHEDFDVVGIVGPWKKDNTAAATSDAIQQQDLSLLIPKVNLNLDVQMNYDTAILPDGSEWAIIDSRKDPAEAAIEFRLSKDFEQ